MSEKFVQILRSRGYTVKAGLKVVCKSEGELDTVKAICNKHKLPITVQFFGPNMFVVTYKHAGK